jgi:hypothetical protein
VVAIKYAARWLPSLGIYCLVASGCTQAIVARYVYQDAEVGVVAIPVNTYQGKLNFRSQAEELMSRHFPEGYEIVRAEEVNQGERILDVGRKTELETDPKVAALNQSFNLGKLNRTTSYEEKDKLQVRECRIIYKKRTAKAPGSKGQFAAVNTLKTPFYIDPNEVMRHQIAVDAVAQSNATAKPTIDHDVQRASARSTEYRTSQPSPAIALPAVDW